MPLREKSEIVDFLERRVLVLFSGAMAEANCRDDVGGDYVEKICFQSDGGGSDKEKIEELIGLHVNITKPDTMSEKDVVSGRKRLYAELRDRSANLIKSEYSLLKN